MFQFPFECAYSSNSVNPESNQLLQCMCDGWTAKCYKGDILKQSYLLVNLEKLGVDYSQVDLRQTGDLYRMYSAYGNWSPHSSELDQRKRMDGRTFKQTDLEQFILQMQIED